ncbi:hypothetical protein G861_03017 [Escherichia coli HVH 209 (4-3062651)]|nr:hypothetical protein G861_03017 [Escherichia coli HVH 209 (4-3062651)]
MTAEEKSVLSLFMIGVLIVVGKVLGRHCAQQYAGVFLHRIPRRDRGLG